MFSITRPNFVASLAALSLLLTLGSVEADAQVKRFKVVGAGIAAEGVPTTLNTPAPHWAIGVATDLGIYYAAGMFELLSIAPDLTGTFSSSQPCVFTAANGDEIAFTYGDTGNGAKQAGQVALTIVGVADDGTTPIVTARFVAEFNPVRAKCTGRFAKVTGGSFIMVAQTEPFVLGASDPVEYSWSGAGTITYGK